MTPEQERSLLQTTLHTNLMVQALVERTLKGGSEIVATTRAIAVEAHRPAKVPFPRSKGEW